MHLCFEEIFEGHLIYLLFQLLKSSLDWTANDNSSIGTDNLQSRKET